MPLFLTSLAVLAGTGLLALLVSRRPGAATAVGASGAVVGAALGLIPAASALLTGERHAFRGGWAVPYGAFALEIDALSAFFLVPVFLLPALAAIYGRAYFLHSAGGKPLGAQMFAFNLLIATMALVVTARNAVLFLIAWEAMALAAYALVAFEHERAEVRRAGWVYLIATHFGTAALVAMFLVFGDRAGGYDFEAFRNAAPWPAATAAALFALAMIGFGAKAGFVPLHVWLPEAHAAAPSPVSAVMSGVLIKMGLYGLLRALSLLGPPAAWWGPVLVAVGMVGAVLGIALALYQRDLKRALAYSSVENMGLITFALGLGYWGQERGEPAVAALGVAGGLLHVWNHTLMKGTLFLGAGSVVHGAHTRDLEQMGGLMRRMPQTGAAMLAGAVALAALPPLNGFASEWLMYLGLMRHGVSADGIGSVTALLLVGVLSLVGAMAALAFVRLVGVALLGQPRSATAAAAHESPASMTGPLWILVAAMVAIGLFPGAVVGATARAQAQILPGADASALRSLEPVGWLSGALWLAIAIVFALWFIAGRGRSRAAAETWGCGYAAPTARMQYTARSFSELLSEHLLIPGIRAKLFRKAPAGLFPAPGLFRSDTTDPLTRGVYEPAFARWAGRFAGFGWLQRGILHLYVFYILLAVVAGLAWASVRTWGFR